LTGRDSAPHINLRRPSPLPLPGPRRLLRIAHRGASARAPENTLAAFAAAIDLKVDAIEIDVHLCADGVPVVIHDDTVDRTTDGRGAVASLRLRELKRLDAGSWFAPRFKGERIPTLEEVFDLARGRCGVNIEIKGAVAAGPRRRGAGRAPLTDDAPAGAVAQALLRSRFRDLLIVSSFSRRALITARPILPRASLGYLASRSVRGLHRLHRQVGLFALHPHVRLATPRRVQYAHRLGLAVIFWTVNDSRSMRRLVALAADGLMSDDPALFRELEPTGRTSGAIVVDSGQG
jgi:glycerophosphoryl diester phosphodiesterase